MSQTDRLLANNRAYAARYQEPQRTASPHLQVAVVACMDARLDLFGALGLVDGDAHLIRNAGGVVTDDVIRSLMISQRQLGTTEIILIHHDKCGLEALDEDEFWERVRLETAVEPEFPLGSFMDPAESVRAGMSRIQESLLIPWRDQVRGFVFEHETGRLSEVTLAGSTSGPSQLHGSETLGG